MGFWLLAQQTCVRGNANVRKCAVYHRRWYMKIQSPISLCCWSLQGYFQSSNGVTGPPTECRPCCCQRTSLSRLKGWWGWWTLGGGTIHRKKARLTHVQQHNDGLRWACSTVQRAPPPENDTMELCIFVHYRLHATWSMNNSHYMAHGR